MIGPLPYIGGKNRLAARIITMIPEHTTYVEVFAGGAQVLFHKPPSKVEILNDLDYEVVNFFRVCQWHAEELARHIRSSPASRRLFELYLRSDPSNLTDVQRAARFLYLQKNAFGGLVVNQHFHYGVSSSSNYNIRRLPEILDAAHHRLERVQIECLPYERLLEKYDRPATFFFVDPPYWGRELYKFNFNEKDFADLEVRLRALRGKFLLTLNDVPEVRELFKGYRITEAEITYTAKSDSTIRFRELLITNYDPA